MMTDGTCKKGEAGRNPRLTDMEPERKNLISSQECFDIQQREALRYWLAMRGGYIREAFQIGRFAQAMHLSYRRALKNERLTP